MALLKQEPNGSWYGPYQRNSDSRFIAVFKYTNGSQTSISYARWLMQEHLGRELTSDEHVDHINEDPTDDRIENLQILTCKENNQKHLKSLTQEERDRRFDKGIECGWTHGTVYGFMKKKCKCDLCDKRKQEWQKHKNQKQRQSSTYVRGPYSKNPSHGTYAKYKRGCKCDDCRAANARETKKRKQRQKDKPKN